jgi:predicted NUDIX family NTP pyrophosphohydrolase
MAVHLSAGLLMCRNTPSQSFEFFLVHPGGPYFKNKDEGVWSIPKGLPDGEEDILLTAQREFQEETGLKPEPPFYELGSIRQKGGKVVHAWAFLGEWNPDEGITCNTFKLEWPPRSGKFQEFPEMDKACWMTYPEASKRIIAEQIPLLSRARELLCKRA